MLPNSVAVAAAAVDRRSRRVAKRPARSAASAAPTARCSRSPCPSRTPRPGRRRRSLLPTRASASASDGLARVQIERAQRRRPLAICRSVRMRRKAAAPIAIRAIAPNVSRSPRETKASPEYHKRAVPATAIITVEVLVMSGLWRFHLHPGSKEPSESSPRRPSRSSKISRGASAPASTSCSRSRRADAGALQRGRPPGLLSPRPRTSVAADWKVGPIPSDLQDRRVEITGPCRSEDDHQRAELGRVGVHGRLRGRDVADMVESSVGPGQSDRRRPPHDHLREPRDRQALRAQSADRDADGAAPGISPARAPLRRRRPAGARDAVRLRHVPFPQRRGSGQGGYRSVLLPAEDAEPPRSPAVERRLPPRAERAEMPSARSRRPS